MFSRVAVKVPVRCWPLPRFNPAALPSCVTAGCGELEALRRLVHDRRRGYGGGKRGKVSGMVPTVESATRGFRCGT